jgi:hypothetical protein
MSRPLLKDDGKLRREKVYVVRSKKNRESLKLVELRWRALPHKVVCATHEVGLGSDILGRMI